MKKFPSVDSISPTQFECMVKNWFESSEPSLQEFDASHQEVVPGLDGGYEMDVVMRFTAFGGARFTVLCECKKHTSPIKRELVQALHSKLQSTGAQKGMLVSTSKFQSGAVEYAKAHGIALLSVYNGSVAYIQNSAHKQLVPVPDVADEFVGVFAYPLKPDWVGPTMASSHINYYLNHFLNN